MDKTLESTLKAGINTKLPTCDDKGVFTDDDDVGHAIDKNVSSLTTGGPTGKDKQKKHYALSAFAHGGLLARSVQIFFHLL